MKAFKYKSKLPKQLDDDSFKLKSTEVSMLTVSIPAHLGLKLPHHWRKHKASSGAPSC